MRAFRLVDCDDCTLFAIWLCGCVLLLTIASSAVGNCAAARADDDFRAALEEVGLLRSLIGVGDVARAGQATSIAWPTAA